MLAKLFNNNNTRKGLSTLICNNKLKLERNFNLNCLLSFQKNSFTINNFDLLDKEINQVKKVNSEFKTNKNIIKKRLNKEKYVNNTPHVNTEEISNKIQEMKKNETNKFKGNLVKTENFLEQKTEKIPENYKSFFDDSIFDGEKTNYSQNKAIKSDEKIIKTDKQKESNLNNNQNKSKIKAEEFNENIDLDEIERKILNRDKAGNASKENNYKDNNYGRKKDSAKPYKNFGKNHDNSIPKSKINAEENDKSGFENKKTYAK